MKKGWFIVNALAVAFIFSGAAFAAQAANVASSARGMTNASTQLQPKCPVGYEACPALMGQCVEMGTCPTSTD